MVVFGRNNR
uniref:Uncharacterized protein n=1 Tax=Nymphaea colorata TaxID=210225 RepID=A0A5K1CTZ6_9MAGN